MSKLTHEDRIKIEALNNAGLSASKIANELGKHRSTITREIARNTKDGEYVANYASNISKCRRSACGKSKLTEDNWTQINVLIQTEWSPEQISGWLKANPEFGFQISHQWIYNHIRENRANGGILHQSLRRQGKPYKNKKIYRGTIKDRVSIELRPEVVNKRLRIGDWEVDSVIGRMHQSALVTLVERSSRYTSIIKVNSKEAEVVADAIIKRANELELPLHTITGDNGTEFSNHKTIAKQLGIDFYFTHPYSSWEKGTNENTNGLIRQYFPKGTDFNSISEDMIKLVENKLNNRPRKCLNFKRPSDFLKV